MNALHKVLTFLTNPLTLALAGLLVVSGWSLVAGKKTSRHCAVTLIPYGFFILWLWLWGTPLMTRWIGLPLEEPYPPIAAAHYPAADAICLLGGGMGYWENAENATSTNTLPEMWQNADRVWMAAQLWKAGKATMITVTGSGAWHSTVPLLQDFGVPTNVVRCIEDAKNTEEEASRIAGLMRASKAGVEVEEKKVLLVTSAWHMRRAEWLFKKAGLDVIPAACDYEVSARHAGKKMASGDFLPDAEVLWRNSYLWKEWFAYWCYRASDVGLRSCTRR